ncbi:tRNA 2'-phosphotransferase 1-like [Centroberyx gerrardi]
MADRDVRLSKSMSYALCHGANQMALQMSAGNGSGAEGAGEAVHGSYLHWSSIQQQGLSRMKRTHIHLAAGLPGEGGVISGMRRDCDLAIFIDVPKALAGKTSR